MRYHQHQNSLICYLDVPYAVLDFFSFTYVYIYVYICILFLYLHVCLFLLCRSWVSGILSHFSDCSTLFTINVKEDRLFQK